MTAAVTAASAAALANPLVAEAAMTPSLKNTLLSVVAGGIVLAAIAAAVVGVSTFDKICLLYTSPSPRDATLSRMPSSA